MLWSLSRPMVIRSIATFALVISTLATTVLTASQVGQVQAITAICAPTSTSTPTPNLGDLDFSTATLYRSDNDILEIQLPRGWQATHLSYADAQGFSFVLGSGSVVYPSVALYVSLYNEAAGSPETVLTHAINDYSGSATFGTIHTAKIGKLNGLGVLAAVHVGANSPANVSDMRVALLPTGKAVLIRAEANNDLWPQAQPVFDKMIDSLVINAENIPTATPFIATATPQPTATINPSVLDFSTATLCKSAHDILEMQVPAGWKIDQAENSNAILWVSMTENGQIDDSQLGVSITIDTITHLLNVPENTSYPSTEAMTQAFIASFYGGLIRNDIKRPEFTDIMPSKLAGQDADTFKVTTFIDQSNSPHIYAQFWVAPLPGGLVMVAGTSYQPTISAQAKPVLDKIIASLVIHPANIPPPTATPTPTATLIPIYVTQTAQIIQTQINNYHLSQTPPPTATRTPIPTFTPTVTFDPADLDFSTATHYKSVHDIVEIQVPASWKIDSGGNGDDGGYVLVSILYGADVPLAYNGTVAPAWFQISVGSQQRVFYWLKGDPVVSADIALKALIVSRGTDGIIQPIKLGTLNAYMVAFAASRAANSPESFHWKFWAALLPNGKAVEATLIIKDSVYDQVMPVIDKMISSLVINTQNLPLLIPTLTATP